MAIRNNGQFIHTVRENGVEKFVWPNKVSDCMFAKKYRLTINKDVGVQDVTVTRSWNENVPSDPYSGFKSDFSGAGQTGTIPDMSTGTARYLASRTYQIGKYRQLQSLTKKIGNDVHGSYDKQTGELVVKVYGLKPNVLVIGTMTGIFGPTSTAYSLSNNSDIYYNDKLTISATAKPGYSLKPFANEVIIKNNYNINIQTQSEKGIIVPALPYASTVRIWSSKTATSYQTVEIPANTEKVINAAPGSYVQHFTTANSKKGSSEYPNIGDVLKLKDLPNGNLSIKISRGDANVKNFFLSKSGDVASGVFGPWTEFYIALNQSGSYQVRGDCVNRHYESPTSAPFYINNGQRYDYTIKSILAYSITWSLVPPEPFWGYWYVSLGTYATFTSNSIAGYKITGSIYADIKDSSESTLGERTVNLDGIVSTVRGSNPIKNTKNNNLIEQTGQGTVGYTYVSVHIDVTIDGVTKTYNDYLTTGV